MAATSMKIEPVGFEKADAMLGKLAIQIRGKAVRSGLRIAGNHVKKAAEALVPVNEHQYEYRATSLEDSLSVVVREGATLYVVVGPSWQLGRHGHLVEGAGGADYHNINVPHHSHGEPTGVTLKKQPFLSEAAIDTRAAQDSAIIDAVRRAVDRVA